MASWFTWSGTSRSIHYPAWHLAVVTDMTERMRLESERDDLLASERTARAQSGTRQLSERRVPRHALARAAHTIEFNFAMDPDAHGAGSTTPTRSRADWPRSSAIRRCKLSLSRISWMYPASFRASFVWTCRPLDLAATIRASLDSLSPAIRREGAPVANLFDPRVRNDLGRSRTAAAGDLESGK